MTVHLVAMETCFIFGIFLRGIHQTLTHVIISKAMGATGWLNLKQSPPPPPHHNLLSLVFLELFPTFHGEFHILDLVQFINHWILSLYITFLITAQTVRSGTKKIAFLIEEGAWKSIKVVGPVAR